MHGDIASCCPYASMRVADTNTVGVSVLILEIYLFLIILMCFISAVSVQVQFIVSCDECVYI